MGLFDFGLRTQYASRIRKLQDEHFKEVADLNETNHKFKMDTEDLKAKHVREITQLKHEIGLAKEKFMIEQQAIVKTAELEAERLKLNAQKEIEKEKSDTRDTVTQEIREALETKADVSAELLTKILRVIPTYRHDRSERTGHGADMAIQIEDTRGKRKKKRKKCD